MSSANSPCAGCKFLRRKCTQECVFAPYFPPDQPQKFANVHKVFGASNVSKILNDLNTSQREDAVNSLAYEAEARLRDPVYGCVGLISILQHRLKQVQKDLQNAKMELASYIGPNVLPILNQEFVPQMASMPPLVVPYNMQQQPMMGMSAPGSFYQQQQQQPPSHQQHVTGSGVSPMTAPAAISPSLYLGSSYVNDMYQIPQEQLFLRQETSQQPPPAEHRTAGEAPSC